MILLNKFMLYWKVAVQPRITIHLNRATVKYMPLVSFEISRVNRREYIMQNFHGFEHQFVIPINIYDKFFVSVCDVVYTNMLTRKHDIKPQPFGIEYHNYAIHTIPDCKYIRFAYDYGALTEYRNALRARLYG